MTLRYRQLTPCPPLSNDKVHGDGNVLHLAECAGTLSYFTALSLHAILTPRVLIPSFDTIYGADDTLLRANHNLVGSSYVYGANHDSLSNAECAPDSSPLC